MRNSKITKTKRSIQRQRGFTIVELMIATIIFSLVLLGAMAAVIQISKLYYKGITNARTQDLNRNVLAEISQSIQFSRNDIVQTLPANGGPSVAITATDTTSRGYFCNGPRRYTYIIDRNLAQNPDTNANLALRRKESRHVLWVDTPVSNCSTSGPADLTVANPCANPTICNDGVELMSERARITKLTLQELQPDSGLWNINISVAYGEDGLLNVVDGRYVCEGATGFSEFCAISELSTTVLRRL